MATPTIHADFMNADPQGRVRLNGVGTVEDLGRLGLRLADGLRIVVHDGELEADGVVVYSTDEHLWVAVIDWDALRPVTKLVVSPRI
ncbi:MAG TPA: hypothetical protein VKE74_22335 [Gemmataceae bacterium]|nr:hypothetical protein [Gemmataceae bacterium]